MASAAAALATVVRWPSPDRLLVRTAEQIETYRRESTQSRVGPSFDVDTQRAAFGGPLPEAGEAPDAVIDRLVQAAEPALVTSNGPRYFGFVIGGALEAATAADMLPSGWDQNAFNSVSSPAAALAEEAAGDWLKDLLGIPKPASFGLVTGGRRQPTPLAWPRAGTGCSAGWLGRRRTRPGRFPPDPGGGQRGTARQHRRFAPAPRPWERRRGGNTRGRQRRHEVDALGEALETIGTAPTIVCAQAGNVNTGACDDLAPHCDLAHRAAGLGPRGWRLRSVGRGQPDHPPPGRRHRPGGLLGLRRPQMAQRPLRLRLRLQRRP